MDLAYIRLLQRAAQAKSGRAVLPGNRDVPQHAASAGVQNVVQRNSGTCRRRSRDGDARRFPWRHPVTIWEAPCPRSGSRQGRTEAWNRFPSAWWS